jgi:hypothetical protein
MEGISYRFQIYNVVLCQLSDEFVDVGEIPRFEIIKKIVKTNPVSFLGIPDHIVHLLSSRCKIFVRDFFKESEGNARAILVNRQFYQLGSALTETQQKLPQKLRRWSLLRSDNLSGRIDPMPIDRNRKISEWIEYYQRFAPMLANCKAGTIGEQTSTFR